MEIADHGYGDARVQSIPRTKSLPSQERWQSMLRYGFPSKYFVARATASRPI
jgi:hypothetical protein